MIAVDALLFDLDGTLVDSKRDITDSVRFLQKLFNAPLSSEAEVAAFIGDGVVKLVQRSLPRLSATELDEAVTMFKKYYREHCLDHTRIYPGVRETLRHFRRKKMAVVTNKPVRVSGYILDKLNLSPFFDVLIGGDSLPKKKPHPDPILNALETMRHFDAKRAVVVGDSPNDILAGRAAGTHTCGVKSNIGNPQKLVDSRPDFVITRMKELMRIFK